METVMRNSKRELDTGGAQEDLPTILVIDDEPAFCEIVCEILETFGYRAHAAHNAVEALSILNSISPDLILTDVMLPDMDGLSLIKCLRSRCSSAGLPIVVVSAKATHETRGAALHAGANAFLLKPFLTGDLREIVERHLR